MQSADTLVMHLPLLLNTTWVIEEQNFFFICNFGNSMPIHHILPAHCTANDDCHSGKINAELLPFGKVPLSTSYPVHYTE